MQKEIDINAFTSPQPVETVQPDPLATHESVREWAESHATEIEQYNAWANQREPYSQRVRRWREQGSSMHAG